MARVFVPNNQALSNETAFVVGDDGVVKFTGDGGDTWLDRSISTQSLYGLFFHHHALTGYVTVNTSSWIQYENFTGAFEHTLDGRTISSFWI